MRLRRLSHILLTQAVRHPFVGVSDRRRYMVTSHITAKLVAVALVLGGALAVAWEDTPLPWHSATISFGYPQEKNFLRITSSQDRELTELTVHCQGKDLVVPPSEFKSLPNVQLDTIRILFSDLYFEGGPYLTIALNFGDRSLAWFLFHNGKFHHITFIKRTSKTTSDYIDKHPGQEPVKTGTSALVRDAPSPKPE